MKLIAASLSLLLTPSFKIVNIEIQDIFFGSGVDLFTTPLFP